MGIKSVNIYIEQATLQISTQVMSVNDEANSKSSEDLALWCLKGRGGEGEAYEGLLSLMAHGDPKSAKDRKIESLALSLSNWCDSLTPRS